MTNIKTTIVNAKLLQKASAVKFGWLAMDTDSRWFWFNKKPKWTIKDGWWAKYGTLENVRFLKLPKRKPSFAPNSLIKCTPRGPILLSTNKMYHRTWGLISIDIANNLIKGARK